MTDEASVDPNQTEPNRSQTHPTEALAAKPNFANIVAAKVKEADTIKPVNMSKYDQIGLKIKKSVRSKFPFTYFAYFAVNVSLVNQ